MIIEYMFVCKRMQGVLQKKEDKVTEKVLSIVSGIISGMTDNEIHDKYGASQDQIDRTRAKFGIV